MELLGEHLAAYPEETRGLGRLDDRVVGWMTFRPHVLLAGVLGGCAALAVGGWSAAAGVPSISLRRGPFLRCLGVRFTRRRRPIGRQREDEGARVNRVGLVCVGGS